MKSKLECCPFCKGDTIDISTKHDKNFGWLSIAVCQQCMAQGSDCGWKKTQQESTDVATKNWNGVNRSAGWVYEAVELWVDTIKSIWRGE